MRIILTLFLVFTLSCVSAPPTPMLIGRVIALSDETVDLYVACSERANYVPTKDGCNSTLLSQKIDETMDISVEFISADLNQPQGYDIYLATSMMYFRIFQRNLNAYTNAEMIARQFFEIQKANSGKAIPTAKFYWVWYVSATSSKQRFDNPPALTPERKIDLLLAVDIGTSIIGKTEGPRLARLKQAIIVLNFVIDDIHD